MAGLGRENRMERRGREGESWKKAELHKSNKLWPRPSSPARAASRLHTNMDEHFGSIAADQHRDVIAGFLLSDGVDQTVRVCNSFAIHAQDQVSRAQTRSERSAILVGWIQQATVQIIEPRTPIVATNGG